MSEGPHLGGPGDRLDDATLDARAEIDQLRSEAASMRRQISRMEREINVLRSSLEIPTLSHEATKMVVGISTDDLIFRLRQHVMRRSAPRMPNGVWALMLEAANHLERMGPRDVPKK